MYAFDVCEIYRTSDHKDVFAQSQAQRLSPFCGNDQPHLLLFHLPTCEQQLNVFNCSIRTLLDTHLPEREIRRCSSDRPWIDDNFRYLIRRRQKALLPGNQLLYRLYRNKVNRGRKSLQRKYYQRKIIKVLPTENP